MSKLYTDIFDSTRRAIWKGLKDVPVTGILGGGTAIALQLGHRISYDFDIFLADPIPKKLLLKIKSAFKGVTIRPQVDSDDELTVSINNVRVTYLYYPFTPLYKTRPTDSLPLFDLRDSAADKAYTIGRRGAWRDYYDLYTLCVKTGFRLKKIIADAEKKFGALFSIKLFLEQLTYADDITDFSIELLNQTPVSPTTVFNYFRQETENIIDKR